MATKNIPKVQLTNQLRQVLTSASYPPDAFAIYFAGWKALGPTGALADPYFGKDGPYLRPLRQGKTVLWHVHMRPQNDPAAALVWDNQTRARLEKTSDSVLIYTHDPMHGYLLIHSVWGAGAHVFCNMSTPRDAQLMNQFADVAEEFMFWGSINL